MSMKTVNLRADVVVIGGGLPGVCAAIAASRGGADTILLERGMNLGGNCGPEIGVHPSDGHRFHPYMAATGVVAEIIDSAVKNSAKTNTFDYHYNICQQWDTVMAEELKKAGVKLLRRHYAHTPIVKEGRIVAIECEDTATYKHVRIDVNHIVIDASGDGNVSAEAGALFRHGREGKDEFGERMAPDKPDDITLGSSLVALVRKTDHEVKFTPPEGTPEFFPGYWGEVNFEPKEGETLKFFFPTETGGELDTIEDDHLIYDRLLGQLYSAWNKVKNVSHVEESKNWELLWVSSRIGKRESRRFVGDYILNGNDVEAGRIFDDAIAVGGFYTDAHYPNPENMEYVTLIPTPFYPPTKLMKEPIYLNFF
ncbi:MAG: FAD-dependent oxidoreductase [Ruminococcaceae bacterium]|nr:FAD-dependent oxidoreductase [Oscillospiraceae bacterium]